MEMKRYSTVHPLFMSFYSKSLYQDVGKNWRKISFLYLFLLLAVCLIPLTFKLHSEVADYLHNEAPKIITQFPVVTIAKGKASADEQMPYVIKDPENNRPLIIIDTTGKTTSLRGNDALVLLTKTRLLFRMSPTETKSLDLSGIDDLTVDQPKLDDWTESFLQYFIYIVYPLTLLLTFLFRLAEALLFGAIGMIFARNLRVPLRYPASVSLAIVSMTPAVIMDTLYNYTDSSLPFWWVINFLVAAGYLFFAVKANAETAS